MGNGNDEEKGARKKGKELKILWDSMLISQTVGLRPQRH